MKRKFLSLILVLMLLPVASLFSACGNKGYNLNNLQNDFNAVKTENEHVVYSNGKYVFDYSDHDNLNAVVENQFPYTQLDEYNEVYKNIMAFAFEYIDECTNNSAVKDKNVKNAVKQNLDDFKYSLHNVDNYVTMLAEVVNVSYDVDVLNEACMSTLQKLFYAYDDLFKKAIAFNETLADLYFNHIIINGNPNIYEIAKENFDPNTVINLFDARLKYQMLNLSACYVEMYIDGGNLSELIVNDGESLDLYAFDYKKNINKINKDFDELVAYEKAINATNKDKYYEFSVQAYNIQATLQNDRNKFLSACAKISYAGLDYTDVTAIEILSAEIVENRYELVCEYNDVLAEMVKITGA